MKIKANEYEPEMVFKIIREWAQQTQTQFGESMNLSKMTIQAYERGVRRYSFETLMKIADQYGLTITIEKK